MGNMLASDTTAGQNMTEGIRCKSYFWVVIERVKRKARVVESIDHGRRQEVGAAAGNVTVETNEPEQLRIVREELKQSNEELETWKQKYEKDIQQLNEQIRVLEDNTQKPDNVQQRDEAEVSSDETDDPQNTHEQLPLAMKDLRQTKEDIETYKHRYEDDVKQLKEQIRILKVEEQRKQGETNEDKKRRALRVMRSLRDCKEPMLWHEVSSEFVSDGKLNLSGVITASTLPDLVCLLCSGEARHVTTLKLVACQLTDDGFIEVCETITKTCKEMTWFGCWGNDKLSSAIESHVKKTLKKLSGLKIFLYDCSISRDCCKRLHKKYGDRIYMRTLFLTKLPKHESQSNLAEIFASFFTEKINRIRSELSSNNAPQFDDVLDKNNHCEMSSFSLQQQMPHLNHARPDQYKTGHISPSIKNIGLYTELVQNYRPVPNLAFVSKVFERVVAKQLSDHRQENDVHEQFQSAYRQHDSTETAGSRSCVVVLVMLDLTAAFETINHAIQLSRLTHNYGVTGAALKWFTSYYFSGRQQLVCIGSEKSSPTPVPFGVPFDVPQGFLLGTLLFTAYISPLGDIIKKFGMEYHLYADDAQLSVSFCPGGDDQLNAIDRLSSCLEDIGKWSRANLLKLNDEKTDVVVFSTKHKLPLMKDIRITIGTTTLNASSNVRNLGVVFDSSLCMTNHISATC
ncbi:hypothetical protein LSAT2_004822 [Lamellibrachia satsuma]|nr:hypothetical protein LSAT2_004822 [Lamellibrachia satsuma]